MAELRVHLVVRTIQNLIFGFRNTVYELDTDLVL